jgi:hypothetical protein
VTTSAGSASVRVGSYSLEVATHAGSFAQFEPEPEAENVEELQAALAEEPEQPPAAVAAIEEFQESADAVTGRIEQADKLLRAAAGGELLRLDNLSGEIDGLVDLLARLDKAGRFEEELKLMRSLNGLLALSLRWLELVRSLRALLRSAQAVGHAPGQAWAHHELGSLHLCAGAAGKASAHLRQALRIEEQLGDLPGRCSTRHNLDSAQRDLALAEDGAVQPPRRFLRSAVLAAAFVLLGGGGGSGIALAIRGGGGGSDLSSATFIVHTNFAPNDPSASITVSVSCTDGGRPDNSPKSATEASPAVFTITHSGNATTCTAREGEAPSGYKSNESGCRNVSMARGRSRSCTITNRRRGVTSATLIVHEDFAPNDRSASVSVSVACTKRGRPGGSPKRASEAAPAVFRITRFRKGAACTATEGAAPTGYAASASSCRSVPIARGGSFSCTILNTRQSIASATFTVDKDFSDANPAKVGISLACDSGTVVDSSKPASQNVPAVFTVTGFGKGATCTASEGPAPPGYTANERECRNVAVTSGGSSSCRIVNNLNSATLTVRKDFTDGNPRSVSVSLVCDSGTVTDAQQSLSVSSPAVFTITGFTDGATCTATEDKVPRAYTRDESNCQDVPLASRGECTIVNAPTG